jgi:hypothetical protein
LAASRNAVISLAAVVAAGVAGIGTPSVAVAERPAPWSDAVSGICAHALLFEGRHEIGTRAGAVSVARDIRASTARRVRNIQALRVRPPRQRLAVRWLDLERHLAGVYASSYVRIYDAIAAANTASLRARLPRVLFRLLHAPDGIRRTAASVGQRLRVPDCTGGGMPNTSALGSWH